MTWSDKGLADWPTAAAALPDAPRERQRRGSTRARFRESEAFSEDMSLDRLESILLEAGGSRPALQRRARALLEADGKPVTRLAVAGRAVALLQAGVPGPPMAARPR